MRLGEKKRLHFRIDRSRKRKISAGLFLLLMVTMFVASAVYFLKIIRPTMMELAKAKVTALAELSIHRAVGQLFIDTDCRELVTLHRLADGSIGSVTSNMSRVNELKVDAAIAITEEISCINETELAIPLGTLTGYDILSGVGPRLPTKLMVYGSTVTDVETDFSETGINQTLLSVKLTVTANLGVVMPSVNMVQEIKTDVPITQTVIVGQIPDNYVNIDRMGEEYEGDVLDIIG